MSTPNALTLAFLASVVLLAVLLVATGYLLARRSSSGAGWAVGRRRGSAEGTSPGPAAQTGPAARATTRATTATATQPEPTGPPPRPRAAVVVNPTKFDDLDGLRQSVDAVLEQQGWAPGRWLETTADDPGQGPARQALEEGVDLVLACGGDGTVRTVAEVLAGTGVPLGLLPGGTGNLLARNLDIDVTDIPESARLTVTGVERPVDVGRLVLDGSGPDRAEHVFCVMAGLGFDAQIMANAPEALKARVGWFAYVLSGVRLLKGQSSRVQLRVDGGPPLRRRVRTVVVGNCGRLTGGLVLMPDARVDDGWLDLVSIAPAGLGGWLAVAVRVLTRTRKGHRRVEHFRCREVTITCERPEQVQVDGDPVGAARVLRIAVERDALLLRVPSAAVPDE